MGDLDHEEFRRPSAPDCLDPKELETGFVESVAGRGTSAVGLGTQKCNVMAPTA